MPEVISATTNVRMLVHPDSKRIIGTTKIFEIWGFHGGEDDNGVLDFISVWTSVL